MRCAAVIILALAACQGPPVEVDTDPAEASAASIDDDRSHLEPMRGFSWVVGKRLAGMPRPGARRALEHDIGFLEHEGVDLLVSLTEEPTDPGVLADHGIDALHIPVKDFTAPTMDQMNTFVNAVRARHADGQAVGIHCTAGLGRSGTMLAAYFVSEGMTAEQALAEIRRLRPGSVETAAQERAIADYADLLRTGRPAR
jgi:atypical dual specificity phosphatase